ncbi:PREDICTED: uncharacterized protein LOC109335142 [Lupinus angustifolius]|uniref:uncharacterized protein LOC109335142 n=1 Tax=Lupinus angustifolius TaxID=3871 RepID=UPI00092F00D1|nr:PREDICTED: uncharacterized protein LOC109335142 [Lupinus angustifolius]
MGCFIACFGLTNKRKLRKTLYNVLDGHQKYGNYKLVPITENSIVPYSYIRDKDGCKEKNSDKSKKKVSFNLNVQIFEPNPSDYQPLDNEEETNENNTAEPEGEGSAALTMRYPSNYRYYNCTNDYDEEDEIVFEESDIEDYDDNDNDEFDDGYEWDDGGGGGGSLGNDEAEVNDQNTSQKKLICYSSVEEESMKNQILLALNDTELKSNTSGRDRGMNMHSVLIPVENLTQWKAIKAKVASSKHKRKENVQPLEKNTSMPLVSEASLSFSPCILEPNVLQSKPLLQEIAVDASLSNWLVSPNYDFSQATIHCH